MANARSSRSFSVIAGMESAARGRLSPLFEFRTPPVTTRVVISGPATAVTDQLQQAVVDQDAVARLHDLGQQLVLDGDTARRAGDVLRGQHQRLPLGDGHAPLLHDADPQLGALQITQDGDGLARGRRRRADAGDGLGVKGLFAVGEVEPGHVHAGLDEGGQQFRLAAGRADGADDLGAQKLKHGVSLASVLLLQAILQPLQQLLALSIASGAPRRVSWYIGRAASRLARRLVEVHRARYPQTPSLRS